MNAADVMSPSKTRLRLWLKLLKASNQIEMELRRKLRDDFNSTLPRFDVMSALARFPDGLKMSEISGLLRVSNGNVTGIVDRLTKEGLAVRVAVPGDRRAHSVRLTPSGQTAFTELAEAHEAWLGSILGDLTEIEIDTLGTVLDRLNQSLTEEGS
jgi:DNA-binding MarR family transcriptional regulator